MVSEAPRAGAHTTGISIGLIWFFVGVALLLVVFLLAFRLFGSPDMLTNLASQAPAAAGAKPGGPAMAEVLIGLAVQVVALFFMLIAGSLIASKGIHLYSAGR